MSVGALDSATISQLKADAADRPDQNLDEVSRRFEELFVNMLVKCVKLWLSQIFLTQMLRTHTSSCSIRKFRKKLLDLVV